MKLIGFAALNALAAVTLANGQKETNMKSIPFAAAIAGAMLIAGPAFAYHPTDRNVRATLEADQLEQIDFEDVQRGSFGAGSSATPAQRSGRSSRVGSHSVEASRPPYQTEHHTR